ncbi:MAG TPA: PAS domain-containing sensor histidine kinase [Prolixibacteraceae bacterium]|nr:PAS domain-containing sensor histidine kinase [Prolixibacteraceae bacterium]
MTKMTEEKYHKNNPRVECPNLLDVFVQSPIAIEMYDKDGKLKDVNQACLDLFGISSLEQVTDFNLFADPNLPANVMYDTSEGKTGKYEIEFNFDLVKKNNLYKSSREGICFLECYINPSFNKNKEINGYIIHVTEITERKKAEFQKEKQAEELQELNATKDKFLSIIAHDLKNPFNAILGFTDLMLKNYHLFDDETFLKGLKTIESASNHAYKLLENLLIWSQNQNGQRQFTPESLNLKSQVTESLSLVESAAITKEINIVIRIRKDIHIFADKNMIDSILRNLISNSIKFSNKGGKVKITAIAVNQELHISVSDNGVGISPDKHSSIFEIGKRSNTIGTDNEQGTGLGLILCKDFTTRHGGEIWLESTPGKGSKFTFSLPLN